MLCVLLMLCVVNDTVCLYASSARQSGTQSVVYQWSNYTFGTILPGFTTSPVPAISHFLFHIYYFIILMFERFINAMCV